MTKLVQLLFLAISFSSYGQLSKDCIYVDPNILIINCERENRDRISEIVFKASSLNAKVIAIDIIFFDKRNKDSIMIKRMSGKTPIILSMGDKNDSSYFNISNCNNGPHSINGNERDNVEFLFPIVRHNQKLRDSFELLVLKYFDYKKYESLKGHLTSFDLASFDAKAKIEFNGNSFNCFYSIDIRNFENINEDLIKDKIVIFGYFGNKPDNPLFKDKEKYAFKVRTTVDNKAKYMYSTLISANIISNLLRKDIRQKDLN
jgi:hypothetical protein